MSALATLGLCALGLALGALAGWLAGRWARERPLRVVTAFLVPFAAGTAGVWYALSNGNRGFAVAATCFVMGSLTATKYSSGVLFRVMTQGEPAEASGDSRTNA